MARKPTGNPPGRPAIKTIPPTKAVGKPMDKNWKGEIPEKVIIMDQVLYWIDLQATASEIAGSFRVSTETLDAHLKHAFGVGFLELKKRTDGAGKMSVRRYQFKMAEKNATMAIWLGKVWLGQTDTSVLVTTPQKQEEIDKDHLIMELKFEIQQLKDANKSKTG